MGKAILNFSYGKMSKLEITEHFFICSEKEHNYGKKVW